MDEIKVQLKREYDEQFHQHLEDQEKLIQENSIKNQGLLEEKEKLL